MHLMHSDGLRSLRGALVGCSTGSGVAARRTPLGPRLLTAVAGILSAGLLHAGSVVAVELRPIVVSQGPGHGCAVTVTGGAACWGGNLSGQLGDGGSEASSSVPVAVAGLGSGVVAVAVGDSFSCALSNVGAVSCWGSGANGRLGSGGTGNSPTPTGVTGLGSGVRAISLGGDHACALLSVGEVRCWGRNHVGQLGNLSIADSAVPVTAISGSPLPVVAISAGRDHTCAVHASGAASCWGSNADGKAGIGSLVGSFLTAPSAVQDPDDELRLDRGGSRPQLR
ncbi:MAG: RCC1 domain-containing protein [Actinomycetota bacterium]